MSSDEGLDTIGLDAVPETLTLGVGFFSRLLCQVIFYNFFFNIFSGFPSSKSKPVGIKRGNTELSLDPYSCAWPWHLKISPLFSPSLILFDPALASEKRCQSAWEQRVHRPRARRWPIKVWLYQRIFGVTWIRSNKIGNGRRHQSIDIKSQFASLFTHSYRHQIWWLIS